MAGRRHPADHGVGALGLWLHFRCAGRPARVVQPVPGAVFRPRRDRLRLLHGHQSRLGLHVKTQVLEQNGQ